MCPAPHKHIATTDNRKTWIENIRRGKMKNSLSIEERFWAKVKKSDTCWEWLGAKDELKYGMFRPIGVLSSSVRAHRVAFVLTYGMFDVSLKVCHKCDNPSCVRPDHLFLGTHRDNARDRDSKGRWIDWHKFCKHENCCHKVKK